MGTMVQLYGLLIAFLIGYSLAPAKVKSADKPMYELVLTHEKYYDKLCTGLQKYGLHTTEYTDFCTSRDTIIILKREMDETIRRVYE